MMMLVMMMISPVTMIAMNETVEKEEEEVRAVGVAVVVVEVLVVEEEEEEEAELSQCELLSISKMTRDGPSAAAPGAFLPRL